jgi:hypothetical protein
MPLSLFAERPGLVAPGSRSGDARPRVDRYIGHLAREGRSPATRANYQRLLTDFARSCRDKTPAELELQDYERFLDRWTDKSPSTLASGVSLVRGFSRFLFDRGYRPSTWRHR